jgi:pimeloyl-ACP methyl ester carboxylesterase
MFADDTARLMEVVGMGSAHILGVSMGGYIAQELAINHPEKVKRLLIGCSGCGGKRAVLMSAERMERFTANKGLTPEQILRKDMDILFSDVFVRDNPGFIDKFVEISMRYYQPADAFFRQWKACLGHDTAERLGGIRGPTLILTGDDDPLVPPENSRILKELIPNASLVTFPGSRHCFFIEAADEFNRQAIDFFKES